ncbi:MAG: ribonuclease R [Planctomyces sp.]|nr:ribonuclease R [Planctomyces sp.]
METRILEVLASKEYRPVVAADLAKMLRVTKKGMAEFRLALENIAAAGKIRVGKKDRIRLKSSAGLISGIVKKISSGAAFVIASEKVPELKGGDIYISPRDVRDAQTGDEVLVRLTTARRSGGQRSGIIEKVVERASNVFVGTYFERGGQGFVRVDGTVFLDPIHVGDPGARGALPEDKVVVEMLRFPSQSRAGEGVLTEVLGKRGDPGIDTLTVIHSLGLPSEFTEDALEEARIEAENFNEENLSGRRDLTHDTIITIDPIDARDFDDAISLTRSDDGHWHLGVHIADVSHFVRPDSALDREARNRGTSVYLPRHVIPMLPEVISNGLASLQQGQVRYTKSVFIEFDAEGMVQGCEVANTAIKVTRRFAYEDVMPIIRNPKQSVPGVTAKVRHLLEAMFELAMLLRRRRFGLGALEMGVPEIEIDFDTQGVVTGAHERHHDESHEIIEEFMLAANIAVAKLLAYKDVPFLRRVHGDPDYLKLKNFQEFCSGLGYELENFQSRQEIQQLIRDVAGKPEQRAINFGLLRSMRQAEYSPEMMGHYALNEQDYCHFTSPIRRYPDLTVHRLIGAIADRRAPVSEEYGELLLQGKHCSNTERRAEKAERELIRIKLLRYMSQHVGEEMDAIITGVENFGLFCQGVSIPAEGLVHSTALSDDFYLFDPVHRTLIGQKTKREFRLGQQIRVLIANVDIDRRQLDLRIVNGKTPPDRSGDNKPKKRPQQPKESSARHQPDLKRPRPKRRKTR